MESIKGDKIKYISIELVLHPDKLEQSKAGMDDIIEFGLFKGIRKLAAPSNDQEFILVVPPKDKTAVALTDDKYMKAFAMDAYNVLSFEVFDGTVRHICFFKADSDDQKEADRIIRMVLAAMKEAGKMTKDDDIIDITLYKELPDLFSDPIKKTVGQMNRVQNVHQQTHSALGSTPYQGATHQGWAGHQSHTSNVIDYTRKPFFFRRKTALPHHATLKKLFLLLDKMEEDDYIEPDWPVVKKEATEPEDTKATSVNEAADEDDFNSWQGCG